MSVDTTRAVSGLPRPVCAPLWKPNQSAAELIRGRVPVAHDRLVHLEGYRTGNNRRQCWLIHCQYLS